MKNRINTVIIKKIIYCFRGCKNGKVYKIISDEEIINQLKTKGGIPVELEGQLEKKQTNKDEFVMFKDGVFIVSSWKVAK